MTLKPPPDQDLVIVGATGDLAYRKLLPALYNLHLAGLLPKKGRIIGYARSPGSDDQFRKMAADAVRQHSRNPLNEGSWPEFAERLCFVSAAQGGYDRVRELLGEKRRLVYLAIPPSAFEPTIRDLASHDLVDGSRLVVEKPFGRDLPSSRHLADTIHQFFDEKQVFRIDHYLGKETVQNILVFRFGNSVFERVWNRDAIDHVQFTVAESIGIEGRGKFYEETGALRDILQNHVFQVLSLLTMEAPSCFEPEDIRDEKAKLFDAMCPLDRDDVVRGQYTAGQIDGKPVPGYRHEPDVDPDSRTETFAALRVEIENWRWAGVPFYLRTGKRMATQLSQVVVVFKEAPVHYFKGTGVERLKPNMLEITIQPEEQIRFQFLAKVPGPDIRVQPVDMHFSYGESFTVEPVDPYERLLHDAMEGDHTLFARADSVDRSWEVVQPILEAMPPIYHYPAGSWGPKEADKLIAPRRWHPR